MWADSVSQATLPATLEQLAKRDRISGAGRVEKRIVCRRRLARPSRYQGLIREKSASRAWEGILLRLSNTNC